jgi:hypothetical protein
MPCFRLSVHLLMRRRSTRSARRSRSERTILLFTHFNRSQPCAATFGRPGAGAGLRRAWRGTDISVGLSCCAPRTADAVTPASCQRVLCTAAEASLAHARNSAAPSRTHAACGTAPARLLLAQRVGANGDGLWQQHSGDQEDPRDHRRQEGHRDEGAAAGQQHTNQPHSNRTGNETNTQAHRQADQHASMAKEPSARVSSRPMRQIVMWAGLSFTMASTGPVACASAWFSQTRSPRAQNASPAQPPALACDGACSAHAELPALARMRRGNATQRLHGRSCAVPDTPRANPQAKPQQASYLRSCRGHTAWRAIRVGTHSLRS